MTDLNKLLNPIFLEEKEIRKLMELLFFSYRDIAAGTDQILEKINFGRTHYRIIYFVGKYMICTMSKEFAEKKGYDDSLMLDHRNHVAEGTGANIFFIKGNTIYTPIPDCFLNGITRQTVIEIANNKNFHIEEKYIKPEDLGSYEEAFLTGTAAEVTPINSIDNIEFAVGENTTTFKLMNDFTDFVNSSS